MSTYTSNSLDFIQRVYRLPATKAFIAQLFGGISVSLAAWILPRDLTSAVPLPAWALIAGSISALVGIYFRMALWWGAINLAFLPSVYLAMSFAIPGWVFFLLFAVLVAIYWNSAQGVPLYLTNRKTWQGIVDLLPNKPGIRFLDIGCGVGGMLGYLSHQRGEGMFQGIESAPFPFLIAKLRFLSNRQKNIHLRFGDMWNLNLSEFDVVYAFLSPVPMKRLFEKVRAEMKPGSIFISNSFKVPNKEPTEIIEIEDSRKTKLLVWRL